MDSDCEFSTNGGIPVAEIGEETYLTFKKALKVANASSKDVTIKLLTDITLTDAIEINNTNGKNITIDGKNGNERYTLTISTDKLEDGSANHSIRVHQTSGTITFQNIDIVHGGNQMLLRLGENKYSNAPTKNLTVNLINMDITSTTAYNICLMATQDLGVFHVEMTNVDVDWDNAKTNNKAEFLRCSENDLQEVHFKAIGCTIDLSGTNNAEAIHVCGKVSGTVEWIGTDIITTDVATTLYTNNGSATITQEVDTVPEFKMAVASANASKGNVIIKLASDIQLTDAIEINNVNGKNITIDGANGNERYTLTISTNKLEDGSANHSILVHQTSGTITFQNMNIVHGGDQMLLRLGENKYSKAPEKNLTVNMINMDITSTSAYNICLMATQDLGVFNIEMTNVDVDWDNAKTNNKAEFLRCSENDLQEVHFKATGCTLDLSGTNNAEAIHVCGKVSGTVEWIGTDIITTDAATTVYTNNGSATITQEVDTAPEFEKAVKSANASKGNVNINLASDIELTSAIEINNAAGKNITIAGVNGSERYTLSITSSSRAIHVKQLSGTITFQNMNIVHGGTQMLLCLGQDSYTEETTKALTVNMIDMDITSTSTYKWCLMSTQDLGQFDINMTNVDVDWNGDNTDTSERAFLRCGKNADNAQTVNFTATGCTIDVSDTTKTQGMYICAGVEGTFTLNDTDIITPGAAVYTNKGSVEFAEDEDCIFTRIYKVATADELIATLVEGKDAKANAVAEDVIIRLLADIELTSSITINNVNGKNITIDGANGDERYTLTINTSNASILVKQLTGDITFQNMNIVHGGSHMLLRLGEDKYNEATMKEDFAVKLINMDITSTSTYKWCLVGTQALGEFTIDMTNVNVDWNGDNTETSERAVLRFGRGVSYAQTVNFTATGCTIDVADTTQTQGMYICKGVSGTFTFNDTDIIASAAEAFYTNKGNVEIEVDDECSGIPDGCRTKYQLFQNVAAFKTANGKYEAPNTVPTGYLFAGWYTDESCTSEFALNETDTVTEAWAKFVPNHVLDVKAQISANLLDGVTSGEKGAIRFVTTVDSSDYQAVGFEYRVIKTTGEVVLKGQSKENDVVYKKLYAIGAKNGEILNYTPEIEFCAVSKYFKAFTIKNIPSSMFDANIEVRPFWITLNGTKVYGETVTKTINQGINASDSEGNVADGNETAASEYTNRVVLLSDPHYMTDNPVSGVDAPSAGMILGYTQVERMAAILNDLNGFANKNSLNGVMVLGDLGTDDYGYRHLSDNANYVQKFKNEVMEKLPVVSYAIPGNHDSYSNNKWNEIFGYDRQYSVKISEDVAFIMLDTFANLWTVDGGGSQYTGINVKWLEKELEKYPTEKIFLCCHYYAEGQIPENDAALRKVIAENDRIVCMFRGHSHNNGMYTPDSLAGIPLIDIGGYAYNVGKETIEESDGTTTTFTNYNKYSESWAWGYQVLEWNENEVHLYHVKTARTYIGSNGTFNFAGAIEDDIVIKLK